MKFFYVILIVIFFMSCGRKNSLVLAPSMDVDKNKVYFYTTDYKNSYLYSLNMSSLEINMEPQIPFLNGDVLGFESKDPKGNIENLYLVENINHRPSRVTVVGENSYINQDTLHFPQNTRDLLIDNEKLYAVGYDKKEISILNLFLEKILLAKAIMHGFSQSILADNQSFEFILKKQNYEDIYVLSVGSLGNSNDTAKLYLLDTKLKNKKNQWTLDGCNRINGGVKLNMWSMIVSCNPAYANLPSPPSLFFIDISNEEPLIRFIEKAERQINYFLGGVVSNQNIVFVTQEINDNHWLDPSIKESYWLNFKTGIKIPTNVAYSMDQNAITNTTVFSCIYDPKVDSSAHHCEKNYFGFTKSSAILNPIFNRIYDNKTIKLMGVHEIHFFDTLPN